MMVWWGWCGGDGVMGMVWWGWCDGGGGDGVVGMVLR